MRIVIQKSGPASVEVDSKVTGAISEGLVILLGIHQEDTEEDTNYLIEKLVNLRLFESNSKHFEQSVMEQGQEVLVISQFTLYAGTKKGRRPDFSEAMKPVEAKEMYEEFIQKLRAKGIKVETGEFGAMMNVKLENRGPITIIIDSKDGKISK